MSSEQPAEIKLTQEQLDRLPTPEPGPPWAGAPIGAFLGVPIRIVDNFRESTIAEQQLKDFRRLLAEQPANRDPQPPI